MQTFKALGALLDYPTAELQAAVGEIHTCLVLEGLVDTQHRHALLDLATHLRVGDLLDLQAEWVALFDCSRRLGLHLHEHSYGESRDRGTAMVRLGQLYRLHGLELAPGQTPDYLPAFCEFLSLVPLAAARHRLADAVAILEVLAERLAAKGSAYAVVPRALATLADRRAAADELVALREAEPPEIDSPEALDRAYEEVPVDFTASSVLQSCPYGGEAAKQRHAQLAQGA